MSNARLISRFGLPALSGGMLIAVLGVPNHCRAAAFGLRNWPIRHSINS